MLSSDKCKVASVGFSVLCVLEWKPGGRGRAVCSDNGTEERTDELHFEKARKASELFLGLGKPVLLFVLQTSLYCCYYGYQAAEFLFW